MRRRISSGNEHKVLLGLVVRRERVACATMLRTATRKRSSSSRFDIAVSALIPAEKSRSKLSGAISAVSLRFSDGVRLHYLVAPRKTRDDVFFRYCILEICEVSSAPEAKRRQRIYCVISHYIHV